jgi:hypothetical protein
MVAELRVISKRLVLYSDNPDFYNYINKRLRPLKKVPYVQNGKIVAFDFYYKKDRESIIKQIINGQLFLDIF